MKATAQKLIPVLSEKERQEIIAYFKVFEKYEKELAEIGTKDLMEHPIFGRLIKEIPKEVSEENSRISREFQRDAIFHDKWEPYIHYSIQQGIIYAKMGLDFKSWYEIIVMVKNYLRPYLHKEYKGDELYAALSGMNRFMDIAMCIIGEAYIKEKQDVIIGDNQKIQKLNEELEKKVKERTAALEKKLVELAESEEKFQKAFQSCAAGISLARLPDYTYYEVNDAYTKMVGYSKEELIGKTSTELGIITEYDKREETIEQIKKLGYARDLQVRLKNRFGVIFHVLASVETIVLGGQKYAINFVYDISERKRAEEQLESVNKELEAFSYSVSHDLRAPLRAVNGYAQMLQEDHSGNLDEEAKRIIETIKYNSTKMGTLIDDLLSFSRLGRKEVQRSEIDMNQLTEGVIHDVWKSSPKTAEIKLNKLASANADYSLLHQVMFNLIANAVKYSSKRKNAFIEISSEVKNNQVVYSVKDNGAGFDMQYAHKLFGVFQRLHKEKDFEGTGVGLAIVQRIINKHGGKIWANAELDKGATFYFSL